MKLTKNGIATYFVVILVSSFFVSLLFLGILDTLYSTEDPICQELNYILESTCLVKNGVSTKVTNLGLNNLELLINGASKQDISSKESQVFVFDTTQETKIELTPVVSLPNKMVSCKSKRQSIDSTTIVKSCN